MEVARKDFRRCAQNGSAGAAMSRNTKGAKFSRLMMAGFLTRMLRMRTENAQRSTSNTRHSMETGRPRAEHRFARNRIQSRSCTMRARESSRPKWNSSRSVKTIESQVRRMILELRRTAMGTLSFIILPSYLIHLIVITSRLHTLAIRLARKFRKKLLLSLFGARLREGEQ